MRTTSVFAALWCGMMCAGWAIAQVPADPKPVPPPAGYEKAAKPDAAAQPAVPAPAGAGTEAKAAADKAAAEADAQAKAKADADAKAAAPPADRRPGTLADWIFTGSPDDKTVADRSGNGHTATLQHGAVLSSGGVVLNGGWIETGVPLSALEDKSFTIEVLAMFTGNPTGGYQNLVGADNDRDFFWGKYNQIGQLYKLQGNGIVAFFTGDNADFAADGKVHRYVFQLDLIEDPVGHVVSMYVDDHPRTASANFGGTLNDDNDSKFVFGAENVAGDGGAANPFAGTILRVRISNTILDSSQFIAIRQPTTAEIKARDEAEAKAKAVTRAEAKGKAKADKAEAEVKAKAEAEAKTKADADAKAQTVANANAEAVPPAQPTILPCVLSAPACRPDYGVNIKYRWDAKPMGKDYTVFVHIIGPDGKQAFQGDHAPSVPTSTWSGRVEYDRAIVVPHEMPAGEYKIMIGLYDAAGQQTLKAAPGVVADGTRYQIGVFKIAPDAPLPQLAPPSLNLDGYQITFNEEFNDLSVSARGPCGPDGTRWMAHTPGNSDFGDAQFADPIEGFPYTVQDGILRIEARKDKAFAAVDAYKREWRAGLLASVDPQGRGFSQQYGYFEMKAKLPPSPGMWPAFWLLGQPSVTDKAKVNPEIDVVEQYGVMPNNLCMALHLWGPDNKHWATGSNAIVPGMTEGFHTYGALVDDNFIVWYYDGSELYREKTPETAKVPLYMLVNLAMGSGWPIDKAISPSYMYVDYVRVYAKKQ